MPREGRDASESFCRPGPKLGREGGQPDPTASKALGDSGTDPHWHVWGHREHQSHEHKQKPQANSLTRDIWLDTDGQGNPEARCGPGLQCHYLSCFLGRVLLQNLGLAAGEERGLEVQAGRK